ncbi:imidazole glycerol phosphate synthase subunit HisF [Blochmannia endosymbiont of Camponotus (Colobopsis) obliquus]|uniref:imidazole glycerol phosphate synthase subunit HisF n=1 Tax=Blochmannia endosymbiont of Camponotus (Colobopsis) obliquus TaxID=1505597 RepID=UPI00061A8358|nr:imidazole glycerol phosphate synthase subunit HisF [Blochmannia endosymbiont of Camponotus (Colobopsis) obliquus]AKC60620.1 imidazole glycerol phosphate synthase subunit hisF [Blochmannia endosymbiont of Camponotus (Colobopsis) obliquus]
MLAKRIIPCLDVFNGKVVKGIQFQNHEIIGDIISLARRYVEEGADELVFYDITASPEHRTVDKNWISRVAEIIDIPFCVAGGIRTLQEAKEILASGADKISINSPALMEPKLIQHLSDNLGTQCIVVGIDTWYNAKKNIYQVKCYTGNTTYTQTTKWNTIEWVKKVQNYGAGEIVLNMMNQDGLQEGYDIVQLCEVRKICHVPLIASGGAGTKQHFLEAFRDANVDGVLAASVFHKKIININSLKNFLINKGIQIRL